MRVEVTAQEAKTDKFTDRVKEWQVSCKTCHEMVGSIEILKLIFKILLLEIIYMLYIYKLYIYVIHRIIQILLTIDLFGN